VIINGHVGSSNIGYNGTHGGFGYGDRNADGSRILEFADGLNLVICNTFFVKQESQLATYAAGPVKSTVDYIIVRQEDKAKVHNVKVILNEECLPKHKLLVMDMWFNTTKRWCKKFAPRGRMPFLPPNQQRQSTEGNNPRKKQQIYNIIDNNSRMEKRLT